MQPPSCFPTRRVFVPPPPPPPTPYTQPRSFSLVPIPPVDYSNMTAEHAKRIVARLGKKTAYHLKKTRKSYYDHKQQFPQSTGVSPRHAAIVQTFLAFENDVQTTTQVVGLEPHHLPQKASEPVFSFSAPQLSLNACLFSYHPSLILLWSRHILPNTSNSQ